MSAWMTTLGLLLVLSEPTQTQTSRVHGLQWNVPKAWKVTTKKDVVTYLIPTSAGPTKVEVYATNYRRAASAWQGLQLQANQDLKRTIDRQWEEELMGVPLLLTKVSYSGKQTLIGLLYTATEGKFHFRLEANSDSYEESEQKWRAVLNSLRPIGTKMPKVEDGTSPLETPEPPKPTAVVFNVANQKAELTKNKVEVTVANRQVVVRLPDKWALNKSGEGFDLSHPKLSTAARVTFLSTLDSPEAGVTAMNWLNKDLANFKQVSYRENYGPKPNKAKNQVFFGLRTGTNEKGPRQALAAVGENSGFYWFLVHETTRDESTFASDRKLLAEFIERVGIEVGT